MVNLIRNQIYNWDSFETLFLQKFWNSDIQRNIKQRLDLEHYQLGGKLNRADYFIQRVVLLKSMTSPPTEEEIINQLLPHFDEII